MQHITDIKDIKKLGTIVCIWAHPDDETFTMGGIMAAAAQNGQKVICITATKGEWGVQDESRWPQVKLGQIRAAELRAAIKELGVESQHFLDFVDGECRDGDEEHAANQIAELIQRYNPDSIMTFGPDGLTGHTDHQAVSRWAGLARLKAGSKAKLYFAALTPDQFAGFNDADTALNFFFNTKKPPICDENNAAICVHLTDELFERKMRALKAMPSQYEKMFSQFDGKLRPAFGVEAFVEAENYAD